MMGSMAQALLVKIGGSLREAGELLDELAGYPGPLILVHGGGPRIGIGSQGWALKPGSTGACG